jgi:hypothetical protein
MWFSLSNFGLIAYTGINCGFWLGVEAVLLGASHLIGCRTLTDLVVRRAVDLGFATWPITVHITTD